MTNRDFQHSRPLDVHRWSEHPEANLFVDTIYSQYLEQAKENKRIRKQHLKVVLLDLYVAWLNDPELNIAVHMTTGAYSDGTIFNKGKSRYNELNIKVSTIEIIHRLRDAKLIGFQKGFEGSPEWQGYISRIWPTKKLTSLFEGAAFGIFDVGYINERETIILRDEDKNDVEYTDNTRIKEMRLILQKYNKLLEKTFIDIPSLNYPRIELPERRIRRKSNKPIYVNITHHDKFVRRVFNNSSFEDGGRFYGGWWQRIDSKYRKEIRLNNSPTVEIDYSSLHIILAYSKTGIDYWNTTHKDPYDLSVRGVNNPEHKRNIVKLFLLLSLNASTEPSLFRAFRSELNYKEYPYSFTDDVLTELLQTIKEHHADIKHLICSGAGLGLMNIDSQMCEYVVSDFVKRDVPILTVHDSFIVQIGQEDRLKELMQTAFEKVTRKEKIHVKFNDNLTKAQFYAHGSLDRQWFYDMFVSIFKNEGTDGYQVRMKKHQTWLIENSNG